MNSSPPNFSESARVQRAPAVLLRLLLSAALLVACVPLLRLTLVSVPQSVSADKTAPNGTQRLTQQEALTGDLRASLRLSGEWADINLSSADLPGQLMRAEVTLPAGARVQRDVTRSEGVLFATYTVSAPEPLINLQPLRLRVSRHGLDLSTRADASQVGHWNVKLGKQVATVLNVTTRSGDQALDLRGAALSTLNSSAQSGDTSVWLPPGFAGVARLGSLSGDLIVGRPGDTQNAPRAGTSTLPESTALKPNVPESTVLESTAQGQTRVSQSGTFDAQTTSGTQRLDLSAFQFARVRASARSGDLRIRLPDRPGVTAVLSTSSGDLRATVPVGLNSGDVNVRTESGDLDLILPLGASVRLTAAPLLGDLQVPGTYVQRGAAYLSPAALLGVPPLRVSLSTRSGSVTVSEGQP